MLTRFRSAMCQVDEKTRGAQSQRGKGGRGSQSTTEHSRERRPARHLKLSWQWVECLSWAVLYYIASCCALQHADAFLPSVRSMIRLHHSSYHLLRAKKRHQEEEAQWQCSHGQPYCIPKLRNRGHIGSGDKFKRYRSQKYS